MDGRFDIKSEENIGTAITITMPVSREQTV